MKKIIKNALVFVALFCLVLPVMAGATNDPFGLNDAAGLNLPSTNQDPKDAAVSIVNYLMTFLGIIAVIVILYGGFQWLTAGGNEDKVGSAKKTIIAGVIGLIIIIAAYAIVQIVVGFANNVISGNQ